MEKRAREITCNTADCAGSETFVLSRLQRFGQIEPTCPPASRATSSPPNCPLAHSCVGIGYRVPTIIVDMSTNTRGSMSAAKNRTLPSQNRNWQPPVCKLRNPLTTSWPPRFSKLSLPSTVGTTSQDLGFQFMSMSQKPSRSIVNSPASDTSRHNKALNLTWCCRTEATKNPARQHRGG